MRTRGVNDVGQVGDRLLQRGIAVDGVLPDLVGVRAQVDLGIGVAVENAGFLGEQVADHVVVTVVLEEGLVGTDNLGVLPQPLPDTGSQPDDPFDPICRKERVTEDFVGLLADTVHATGTLDQTNDGPGKVVVDDDRRILEVLALAEHIRGDQDIEFVGGGDVVAFTVAFRAEPPGQFRRVFRIPGDGRDALNAAIHEFC